MVRFVVHRSVTGIASAGVCVAILKAIFDVAYHETHRNNLETNGETNTSTEVPKAYTLEL